MSDGTKRSDGDSYVLPLTAPQRTTYGVGWWWRDHGHADRFAGGSPPTMLGGEGRGEGFRERATDVLVGNHAVEKETGHPSHRGPGTGSGEVGIKRTKKKRGVVVRCKVGEPLPRERNAGRGRGGETDCKTQSMEGCWMV